MINCINFTENRSAKKTNFTGLATVARIIPYEATDVFVKIFKEKTPATFLTTLSKLLKRSANELQSIYGIKDPKGLDEKFKVLKTSAQKLAELKKMNPAINEELSPLLKGGFETMFLNFLAKEGFIDEKNIFKNLPAKLAVLKKGERTIDDNLSKLADKVIVTQGVKLSNPTAKKAVVLGLQDENLNLSADEITINNSVLDKLRAKKEIIGSNISGNLAASENEGINLHKKSEIKNLFANKRIRVENHTGERLTTISGYTVVNGEKNVIGEILTQQALEAKNLSAHSINCTEGSINISGKANNISLIHAQNDIKARNLETKDITAVTRDVELSGNSKVTGYINARKFIPIGENITVLKPVRGINASTSMSFFIKNLLNKTRRLQSGKNDIA